MKQTAWIPLKMHIIIIDEISMVSAQLLGRLELVISKVARRRGLYKLRKDGTSRPVGGVNTLLFGDWWQLKPVSGTALFADPASASGGVTAHGLQLMWGEPLTLYTAAGISRSRYDVEMGGTTAS